MLVQGKAASLQELCQIGTLSRAGALPYWKRTRIRPSMVCSRTRLGCLCFPRAPPASLGSGAAPLSWGSGHEPRHVGAGPSHLHTSLLRGER